MAGFTTKYRAFRGPHPGEPVEKQVAFWSKDLALSREWLDTSKKQGNKSGIRRATAAVKEAQDNLRRLGR